MLKITSNLSSSTYNPLTSSLMDKAYPIVPCPSCYEEIIKFIYMDIIRYLRKPAYTVILTAVVEYRERIGWKNMQYNVLNLRPTV